MNVAALSRWRSLCLVAALFAAAILLTARPAPAG